MEIIVSHGSCLEKPGVYIIENLITNKVYIGSSTMKVIKRIYHHISMLRANKHKNKYLQNAFNKYGENSFCVSIIENTEKHNTLEREQYYINREEKQNLYNINPLASGTPNMSKETILKRAETLRKKYASGEIQSNFKKGQGGFAAINNYKLRESTPEEKHWLETCIKADKFISYED